MNKFKMYKDLREWIDAGGGIANAIYDSPHQRAEFAPYVVEALLKDVPKRHIPGHVLEELERELEIVHKPKKRFWPW